MNLYFDNAATSYPKPDAVYERMQQFMREIGVSSGRGTYRRALEADRVVYETRQVLARLFNVRDSARIVFTSNATEALNLAIKGLLRAGDHVVTSSMEHNAVWRPLKRLEREKGIGLTVVPCAADGSLEPEDVEEALRPETRLLALVHASNVTGTLMPVEAIGRMARSKGILFLVDAAQTAGVCPIDVEEMGVDLLAFTGHKGLLGPPGTGGLYVHEGIELEPLKEGGTGEESILETQPEALPDRYEAGTLNAPGIAGLGAGVEFILAKTVECIREHEERLTAYLLRGLSGLEGVQIYGPCAPGRQVGVVSIHIAEYGPEEVGYVLDQTYGIMVRTGLHCAPCAHRTIGTLERGTLRISLGYGNTEAQVDLLIHALSEIISGTGERYVCSLVNCEL